ncbi:lactonase family protein [Segetibacter sp. 3557_3]|uniref:lactonase family protein n=1 Tax=Segetibacter sp. 3557_3 TaxID=2547429 RepID=UPI001058D850|nr:lactonase family protein [Segetibacter sp. 3557_3]TDH29120.1 lactonase family protein [Segetibacter sp. 3557_3]
MRFYCVLLLILVTNIASGQNFYLFVGTYTDRGSKGIYVYDFNSVTGTATWVSNTEGTVNPSYLAVAPGNRHLYAVTETARENAGSVSAFSFDPVSGKLTFINKQLSGGDNPCYVSVHSGGKWIAVGNYSGGSLSVLPVDSDGSLQPFSQNIVFTGKSVHKSRQEKSHVHSTVFSPDYKQLFVPDLGTDKVMIYDFNASAKQPLTPAKKPFEAVTAGNGPRHFTFHPGGKFAYLIEEMNGSVAAYRYSKKSLHFIGRTLTHPEGYSGAIGSADIHLSPDGRFLYASNRGDENTISIFAVDQQSGKLKTVGHVSTQGKVPRNFTIDPTGNFLLVANQATNNIVIFKRDLQTGLVTATGQELKVPTPVCLQMITK